ERHESGFEYNLVSQTSPFRSYSPDSGSETQYINPASILATAPMAEWHYGFDSFDNSAA
ncbi:hypothetical protein K4F52_010363, partial [Lecanicillium sp. MT-2017a]